MVAPATPLHKVAGRRVAGSTSGASLSSSARSSRARGCAHAASCELLATRPQRRRHAFNRHDVNRLTLTRPIGIQLLAGLLTIYTMGGFLLAIRMITEQDARYRWWIIVVAAAAFAVASGAATLAVWRIERRAPLLLIACGALGSALCLALPAAVPSEAIAPGMWRAAIQGAILILAFLLLAAWYVRSVVRARS